jgi:endonuclease G
MSTRPLRAPGDFRYLLPPERQELIDAFQQTPATYDAPTRARFLELVNRRFVSNFMPLRSMDPVEQLENDLIAMSRVERLTDGTVPLEQWLAVAVNRFKDLPQGDVFKATYDRVHAHIPAVATMDDAETPTRDFQEILTDGMDDMQDVSFLRLGVERLDGVAKLLVPRFDNGQPTVLPGTTTPQVGAGTGWLIAPDLLVTNFHVIRNRSADEAVPSDQDLRAQVKGTEAQFFYDALEREGRKIAVIALVAGGRDRTEDWALLRLAESPNVSPLPLRADVVTLPPDEQTLKGTLKRGLAVNIVQHPGGGPKRIAIRKNLVYSAEYPLLHYFTDTLSGSSGSPVFDDAWRVIALHRAAVQKRAELNGRTLGYINEGVQLHNVMARFRELAQTDASVAQALQEVDQAQAAYQSN